METISIYGDNRFPAYDKTRVACRGIVVQEDRILLTYETNTDQWFTPGGGLEATETEADCCRRELAEETGYLVQVGQLYATIHEYYEDWLFVTHYFVCQITGETERFLTAREREVGLEPRWLPLEEAVTLFSKHQEYAYDEMKRGSYLRDYRALEAYCRLPRIIL